MHKRAMLIAEIDDEGGIAWLWQVNPGKRPRPVKDAASCLQIIDDLTIFGASKSAIITWLTRQADQQA